MSYPPQTPSFGLPPEPETDPAPELMSPESGESVHALIAEARETADALLARARQEAAESAQLHSAYQRACREAVAAGLGVATITGLQMECSRVCDVRVEGSVPAPGRWVEVQVRETRSRDWVSCSLPQAAVFAPEGEDRGDELVAAVMEGREPVQPLPSAITPADRCRMKELEKAVKDWNQRVVNCALAADDAGRVRLAPPTENRRRVWAASLRETWAGRYPIEVEGLDGPEAQIRLREALFGSCAWRDLLLFDPTSPLFQRYARWVGGRDARDRQHLATRREDAERHQRRLDLIDDAREALDHALRDGYYCWYEAVTVREGEFGAPIIRLPRTDVVRGKAVPVSLFVDPDLSQNGWSVEYSNGTRASADVRFEPKPNRLGGATPLGKYLHAYFSRAAGDDSDPLLWATAR